LREFAEFNREFVDGIRAAKRAGQTTDQVVAGWKYPDRYKGYSPDMNRLAGDVELIFKELP
jgi:hypothetical protein